MTSLTLVGGGGFDECEVKNRVLVETPLVRVCSSTLILEPNPGHSKHHLITRPSICESRPRVPSRHPISVFKLSGVVSSP